MFPALYLNFSKLIFATIALATFCGSSFAQFKVEVSGLGVAQLPIAITAFKGDETAPQKIASIVQADLLRSGQFKSIESPVTGQDETTRPDFTALKQKGADFLVQGSTTRLADGRYDVRFRLYDVVRAQDMGSSSYAVPAQDLRLTAHRIADFIYEKLTGEKGIFASRIAYVTKANKRFNLWVADSDGEGAQSAVQSAEPIISASWSPNGRQLAYVSMVKKPVVYILDVSTGANRAVADFKGSNSAPAWSPDGRTLAITLSRDGHSQIYALPVAGGEPRRLSQSGGIDTEPVYSPDGTQIYFVSDRGGAPQIYRMNASGESGAAAQRVSFVGNYNISPALSPDGKRLAYISRIGGAFKLHVMDLVTGAAQNISEGSADERPSFAPNSKLVLFATRIGNQEALMTSTLDGKIKARLSSQSGDIREPHWGK